MKKLAIVVTHPIQYYAPVLQLLHQRGIIDIKVFYTLGKTDGQLYDHGFKKEIAWDIPLLDGYNYEWLENTSTHAGSHHYRGIVNPKLISAIESYAADAILMIGWAYNSHLKAIRHFKNKVPVYFRGDSNLLDQKSGIKSLLRNIFLKWVYRHIDHAFCVGSNNKAYYKKYGLTEKQLTFAPHAIDNERFATSRITEAAKLREDFGIMSDDILILFAGKLEEKKSPELLLQAFLAANFNNVHLLFVGNGPLESSVKQQAAAHPSVHFLDFCNQQYMPVVYQAADLYCLPSGGPNETWGLAVNEAMACGTAVLVSDKVGCAADLVKPGFNGGIFRCDDVADLTQKLIGLSITRSKLKEFGNNGKTLIKDWNFTKIAQVVEQQLIADTTT